MNKNATPSEIAEALRNMANEDIRNFRLPMKIEFFLNEIWTDAAIQNAIIDALLARNVSENGIPVGIHARVMRDDTGNPARLHFFHASFPNQIEVRLPLSFAAAINNRSAAFMSDFSTHSMIHPLQMERSNSRN
jgi:hypothetical protein